MERIVSLGDKLELKKISLNDKDEKKGHIYISQVLDFKRDDLLKVAMPIVNGRVVPLTVNENFTAMFYTSKGMYEAKVVITDRYKEKNLFILEVEIMSSFTKVQRRQYFRYECNLPIQYRVVEEVSQGNKEEEQTDIIWGKAVMVDLSGGGAKFITRDKLEAGVNLNLLFNLESVLGCSTIDTQAFLIASVKSQRRNDLYEQRVEFIGMDDAKREIIIKYIFEMERLKRQKEKGLV